MLPNDEKKRALVDAKFGLGSYDESLNKVKPHRCAVYFNKSFKDLTEFKLEGICQFVSCVFSNEEPENDLDKNPFFTSQKP
jgi:hypothetical protein